MLSKKVTAFIKSNSLILPNDHIIVAVSGGRDSISLLYLLQSLKTKFKFTLSAVHVNHGLRGQESDADERFVKTICDSLGMDCSFHGLSGFTKDSGENSLRIARYDKFEKEAIKFKNGKIATAHHLDDQLETYLMRMFKGSGPKGLLGIPEKRGKYIRPLLGCSRREIDQYCKEENLLFRDDSSNAETNKLRNKIRSHLTPVLDGLFGDDYLLLFSKSHNALKGFYKEYFDSNIIHFEKLVIKDKDQLVITKSDWLAFSKYQKHHFLEYCFSYIYDLPFMIQSGQLNEFTRFVDSAKTGSQFQFSENQKVLKDRLQLVFFIPQQNQDKCWELNVGQNVNCGHCFISLKRVEEKKIQLSDNPNIEFISGDNLNFPLIVRFWRKGDFFYPLGNTGKQKLSDFFVNQKIDVLEKSKIPLLLTGNEIIWVGGKRISELYKVTNESKTVYKIEIEKVS